MSTQHVIGTAGHVDHGKTLLIEALTGIDADRLPEEKRRGLTIDLGFAHFFAPDGRAVGVIDVPGHERFIRNMAAGAWALDLGLLVVAADDGWMQQSGDHTAVLRLMGVPRLIAVINKCDVVSSERARQVAEQAAGECRRLGYAEVPSIQVSAAEGRGIDRLKDLILRELQSLEHTAASAAGEAGTAHLYVDRVFTVKGSGTVVTGTLKGGPLERGQELTLLPEGAGVRIRGLQSYHQDCTLVRAVSRVAVNCSGTAGQRIVRGDLLAGDGHPFRSVRELIARISPVPGSETPVQLKRDTEAEIAVGTGHRLARITRLASGALIRIRLEQPIALHWNQPFVLIRHGGSTILGGGRVLWLGKTDRERRLALARMESNLPPELNRDHWIRLKLSLEGAVSPEEAGETRLSDSLRRDTVQLQGWLLSSECRDRLETRIRELAGAPGGARLDELPGRMRGESEVLVRLVADTLTGRGELALRAGILFPRSENEPQVSPMGRQLLRDLRAGGSRGLELSKLKFAGARKELRNLVRVDLAVSLDGDIYYDKGNYLELVRSCLAHLKVGGTLTIADAKSRTQLSRKFIIPLLNRMERDGFVQRRGDERTVTAKPD